MLKIYTMRHVNEQPTEVTMPPDLASEAALLGVELNASEAAAIAGLLGGTACLGPIDEHIRHEIMFSPYRDYPDMDAQLASRELTLYGIFQTVRTVRRANKSD